jgi:hypothetical protein
MLARKKMAAVSQAAGSVRTARVSRRVPLGGEVVVVVVRFSCWRRRRATFFSRRVRYGAVWGESGMMCQARAAARTEGKPSIRKSRRQGAMGPDSASARISQAREEAKEVASGAAVGASVRTRNYFDQFLGGILLPDMKMAVLNASSSRLKKNDK